MPSDVTQRLILGRFGVIVLGIVLVLKRSCRVRKETIENLFFLRAYNATNARWRKISTDTCCIRLG